METAVEHILTNSYKDGMISFMEAHPEHFEEVIELAVSDKQPYARRAAWLLWSCMNENDYRIQKHIQKIIDSITTKQDGHQRDLLKILLKMELNEEQEGYLFHVCVSLWEKIHKKPSVRFGAFQFMLKIARNHPDLSHEITLYTQDQYLDSLSPGVKRSIAKMVKKYTNSLI